MLVEIEIRRRARKRLEVNATTVALEPPTSCRAVDIQPVEHDHEWSARPAKQSLEECLDVLGADIVRRHVEPEAKALRLEAYLNGPATRWMIQAHARCSRPTSQGEHSPRMGVDPMFMR